MANLTQAQVDGWLKAKNPIAGKSDGSGLTFCLSARGTASWTLRYRFAGRMRELTLTNDTSVQNARKLARAQRVLIDQGSDPAAQKRKTRLALLKAKTFAELAEDYLQSAAPDLATVTRQGQKQSSTGTSCPGSRR